MELSYLSELLLNDNQLENLDISKNPEIDFFAANNNSNLTCVQVSQDQLEKIRSSEGIGYWLIDGATEFSVNCD